ncbi:DUF1405 domain-containing protein [Litorilinea aerophila]|nr:DUF1405 domain-containing protein [Litorilinea aerophila]MCC9078771.1 DUF1405 domain-containing protein [Litorilinea aerophila]OUC08763.1 hypothetical protein RY27_07015 [Litorilinea aerophila]GIV78768.1 MAG: hypothetical protein KatS3mg050_3162 [Litorilinea sp.]
MWSRTWWQGQIAWLHSLIARPELLTLFLVIDVAAYFGGLLYWYGYVMADPTTPLWVWPFIPDCPLFGLLGGIGLLMATAHTRWSPGARVRASRTLWVAAGVSVGIWLSTYLPGAPVGWQQQAAMFGVWSWSLLVAALTFRQAPVWLLSLFAFGQIKYGVWTVTAWLVFWRNTGLVYGAPLFTFDSVFMTLTHLGLIAQGVVLLTYFRPNLRAAAIAFLWFALSDFVDYGLGYYPAIPEQFIPLPIMQWSTVAMTGLLSALLVWLARRPVEDPLGGMEHAGASQPIG